tara:strand:- start:180 stop:326 length:147 start_codon:yes stop_codon:yes gene_type:complete
MKKIFLMFTIFLLILSCQAVEKLETSNKKKQKTIKLNITSDPNIKASE